MLSTEYDLYAKMYAMDNIKIAPDFGIWLNAELIKRDWSQSDLAKKSGLSRGTISNIMSGLRGVGTDSLNAIAKALQLSPSIVFQAAGLLPPAAEGGEEREEMKYLFSRLTPEDRREILELMRFKVERSSRGK